MNEKSPQIDASILADGLSTERVTEPQLQALYMQCETILSDCGERSTVNGVPAIVSRPYVTTTVTNDSGTTKEYYARVFRYIPGKNKTSQERDLPGVVLDETKEISVQTPNPFAMHFVGLGSSVRLQFDDGKGIDPLVNNPQHVQLFKQLVESIETAELSENEAKQQARQNRRHNRIYDLKNNLITVAQGVGILAVVGAIGFGIYEAAEHIDTRSDTQKFDANKSINQLASGTILSVGETASPDFSTELFDNAQLAVNKVPSSKGYSCGTRDEDTCHNKLEGNGTYREIIVTSSKKGKNCSSMSIEPNVPFGARLKAWSDFVDPNSGKSRTNQLLVTYALSSVKVCWNGQELNDNDDPRVVVQLGTPAPAPVKPIK